MKIKILLVEDDTSLGFIISDQLRAEGYTVTLCSDGSEGFQRFMDDDFHMCIFDVMMPKKDGFSLAQDIRKVNPSIPILFLSAKSSDEDKVKGFKSGGDDYLTKPFNSEELSLRVQAMLRRVNIQTAKDEENILKLGEYSLDMINHVLSHAKFEKVLTKKEELILLMLSKFKNQVVSREIVLNGVWGNDDYFVGRSLDVFITKLRKYLKHDSKIQIINVHGIGFKLEVEE